MISAPDSPEIRATTSKPEARSGAVQFEIAATADVFNLASERGTDPQRVIRERVEAERRRKDAAAYESKMQRTLAECPGFVGADAPSSPVAIGRVVIDPRLVKDALPWLKRRFRVSESLMIEPVIDGISVEIIPKVRAKRGVGLRLKVSFNKPQQFELSLFSESEQTQ